MVDEQYKHLSNGFYIEPQKEEILGSFFSHLRISTINNDLESCPKKQKTGKRPNGQIRVKKTHLWKKKSQMTSFGIFHGLNLRKSLMKSD